MSDIFLSYSREDQATARRFAEALAGEGFSVWWDQTLHMGEAYDKVTEKALREAKAVVVLWSKTSVESRWVRAEAITADRNGTLAPVMIEACDRPIMFELTQTADLSQWRGETGYPAWQAFLSELRRFVYGEGVPDTPVQAPAHAGSVQAAAGSRQRRNWLVVAGLALLAAAAGWWALDRLRGPSAPVPAAAAQAEQVTLAVLPFADLSPARDQEYFSDGLTEEILNQLAQIPELRVTGRTSSFSFKGKNEDLRVIAQKLGVANLLEGSIRKDGDKLRITAQLIEGRDGGHLWSKTYDRPMRDVFIVQEDIARDVAQALSIRLDVGAMSRARGGTTDLAAFDRYLRARNLLLQGGVEEARQAVQQLREAVAIDPQFARAWLALAAALNGTTGATAGLSDNEAAPLLKEADEARVRALALVPDSRVARRERAAQLLAAKRWTEAAAELDALRKSAPLAAEVAEDADVYASFFTATGRVNEAVQEMRRTLQVEPLSLFLSTNLQNMLDVVGRDGEAQQEYERSRGLPGNRQRADWVALLRLLSREDADPQQVRAQVLQVTSGGDLSVPFVGELTRTVGDREAARAIARQAYEDPANQDLIRMAVVAALADALGDPELTLAVLRKVALEQGFTVIVWMLPHSGVRSEPGFKVLLQELGLVDHFRATGNWGDFCRPLGDTDFECS